VRSDIIPPNRFITIALIIGLLALIAYGAYNRDPATIAIVVALLLFFGLPALLLFSLNRRARQRPLSPPDDATDHG
jgi:Flp pilus assembly protein TadB